MHINLHNFVLQNLDKRQVPWTQVARDTGIPYETLKKIASRRTPNPGINHVQTLADYFKAQAPVDIAQEAIETVAHTVQTAQVGALRTGIIRRHINRREKDGLSDLERRSKNGPTFQALESGVA